MGMFRQQSPNQRNLWILPILVVRQSRPKKQPGFGGEWLISFRFNGELVII